MYYACGGVTAAFGRTIATAEPLGEAQELSLDPPWAGFVAGLLVAVRTGCASPARLDASARQRSPEHTTRVGARERSDRAPSRVGSGLTEAGRMRHTQHTVDPD